MNQQDGVYNTTMPGVLLLLPQVYINSLTRTTVYLLIPVCITSLCLRE
jgi:hypothetical protein